MARILELRGIENREYILKLRDGSEHRSSRIYADRIGDRLRDKTESSSPLSADRRANQKLANSSPRSQSGLRSLSA